MRERFPNVRDAISEASYNLALTKYDKEKVSLFYYNLAEERLLIRYPYKNAQDIHTILCGIFASDNKVKKDFFFEMEKEFKQFLINDPLSFYCTSEGGHTHLIDIMHIGLEMGRKNLQSSPIKPTTRATVILKMRDVLSYLNDLFSPTGDSTDTNKNRILRYLLLKVDENGFTSLIQAVNTHSLIILTEYLKMVQNALERNVITEKQLEILFNHKLKSKFSVIGLVADSMKTRKNKIYTLAILLKFILKNHRNPAAFLSELIEFRSPVLENPKISEFTNYLKAAPILLASKEKEKSAAEMKKLHNKALVQLELLTEEALKNENEMYEKSIISLKQTVVPDKLVSVVPEEDNEKSFKTEDLGDMEGVDESKILSEKEGKGKEEEEEKEITIPLHVIADMKNEIHDLKDRITKLEIKAAEAEKNHVEEEKQLNPLNIEFQLANGGMKKPRRRKKISKKSYNSTNSLQETFDSVPKQERPTNCCFRLFSYFMGSANPAMNEDNMEKMRKHAKKTA